MRTAIDTNILSALWSGEPTSRALAVKLGTAKFDGALLISPAVFAELHAYPGASSGFVSDFLEATGVSVDYRLEPRVWTVTAERFARYAERRRSSSGVNPKRLLADFLVGAHALVQADRLMTLDPTRYEQDFPELELY